jgi:arginyl-tRNA synthetase
MLKQKINLIILKILQKDPKYKDLLKEIDFKVEIPKDKNFGDYSTNLALKLGAKLKTNPIEIAKDLKEKINQNNKFFLKIEVAPPGFLNFWLNKNFIIAEFKNVLKNKNFGSGKKNNKKIIFEYSDPNIAKKMHFGHLRGTIIGDALANIYEFLGYKIIRWNYLGDWGTQFGNLIAAYKLWGKKEKILKNPINEMLKLYIRFHEEMKKNESLAKMGQEEFSKLEKGDKENKKLWEWFKKESLIEFKKIYKLLGINFDIWIGESFYEKEIPKVIKLLKNKGLLVESSGALIVNLEKFNLPPALVLKSDEASLYLTRDIANLLYRIKKFNPEKIIYVVGNEQTLHFNQLFAIAKLLNIDTQKLEHIKYGLVLGENRKKFKTREGKFITLEEVLNKIIKLAFKIASKNKNLSLKEKQKIAEIIGIGALKYNDLKEHRHHNIYFDWKKMLDLKGESAPYLQYSYVRLKNILKKAKAKNLADTSKINYLNHDLEINLMKKILEFPEAVELSASNYLTSFLAHYLYELAVLANKFYENLPVLKEKNNNIKTGRLILINELGEIIKKGLNLLGIKVPEKM